MLCKSLCSSFKVARPCFSTLSSFFFLWQRSWDTLNIINLITPYIPRPQLRNKRLHLFNPAPPSVSNLPQIRKENYTLEKSLSHSDIVSTSRWWPITMPDIVPERRLIKGEHVNPLVELLTIFWLTVFFVFFLWRARVLDRTRTWARITRGWLLSTSGKKTKDYFSRDKIGESEERRERTKAEKLGCVAGERARYFPVKWTILSRRILQLNRRGLAGEWKFPELRWLRSWSYIPNLLIRTNFTTM